MKKIKSTVNYVVPHWNFCNSDNIINGGELTNDTCKFCVKTKTGRFCLLYEESLSVNDGLITKVRACCEATVGYPSVIDPVPPPPPVVNPKDLMKQSIDLYVKTLTELMTQGYPQPIADKVARQYVLGDK